MPTSEMLGTNGRPHPGGSESNIAEDSAEMRLSTQV